MNSLEKMREAFSRDEFAKAAGIQILEAGEQGVVCEMPITKLHENARGTVMGGAIFTLADFCASVAANWDSTEGTTITLQANINYLSASKGSKLLAYGKRIRKGGSTAVHEVEIKDDLGNPVAIATVTGYVLRGKK